MLRYAVMAPFSNIQAEQLTPYASIPLRRTRDPVAHPFLGGNASPSGSRPKRTFGAAALGTCATRRGARCRPWCASARSLWPAQTLGASPRSTRTLPAARSPSCTRLSGRACAAPDGDSVAAVAGALLGALHGLEALPVALISRLELGWVVDALARDLALQVRENQAGDGWKGDGYEEPLDPWWDTKYPGV